eukprot:849738-Pyramimonas_sp.AAC.1
MYNRTNEIYPAQELRARLVWAGALFTNLVVVVLWTVRQCYYNCDRRSLAPLSPPSDGTDPPSYGTWISPRRNQYVAHGARSWEYWVFVTLVTSVLDVCAPHVLYNTPGL